MSPYKAANIKACAKNRVGEMIPDQRQNKRKKFQGMTYRHSCILLIGGLESPLLFLT